MSITYARIVGDRAIDITVVEDADQLATMYHPDLIPEFVIVPDGTVTGDIYHEDTDSWEHPEPQPEPEPIVTYERMTPMTFYLSFTARERIAIKKSTDDLVMEFWATYELAAASGTMVDPMLGSVVEGLEWLVEQKILASPDRIPQIRAGIAQ